MVNQQEAASRRNKRESSTGRKFVAAIDFGTTSVRCFLYDHQGRVRSRAAEKVKQLYPQQGWNEIEPEEAWNKFQSVFRAALNNVDAQSSDVKALGIATQRGTFVTWDKRNGKTFHNLITWKDLRADQMVKSWNSSWTLRGIRWGSVLLHCVTRNKRYFAGSAFQFMNSIVNLRLCWALDNYPELRRAAQEGNASFGTIDSYLLYRLTQGRLHATDYSNVCVTGLWDPYTFHWVDWMINLLAIPKSILPEIKDTCGDWGSTHRDVFGVEIPIKCIVSDQGASLFGSFCFNEGDVRLSMGTGTFLSVNTGTKPHASIAGLYPVVGWKIGDEIVMVAEGQSSDTSTVIDWCQAIDLFEEYTDIDAVVTSIKSSDDVYFVPAFSGIQAPVNDLTAATGFIGMKPSTTKAHLLRAAIESLAFRAYQMCQLMYQESGQVIRTMRVDGGVCRNDFLMQLVSDLTLATVERPVSVESAVRGAAMMAGIEAGIWKSRDELKPMLEVERVFKPAESRWLDYAPLYSSWKNAVRRLTHWY